MLRVLVFLVVWPAFLWPVAAQDSYQQFIDAGVSRAFRSEWKQAADNFAAAKLMLKTAADERLLLWQRAAALHLSFDSMTQAERLKIFPTLKNVLQRLIVASGNDTVPQRLYRRLEEWHLRRQEMVFVPGGDFMMGSNIEQYSAEYPLHKVYVSSFMMDKLEVSNGEYLLFLRAQRRHIDAQGHSWIALGRKNCPIRFEDGNYVVADSMRNRPVSFVSWFGAQAYAEWMGKRLPTEAEWEYACRGGALGKGRSYRHLQGIEYKAWFRTNAPGCLPQERARLEANQLGIYDMSGNVWEWCSDWFLHEFYTLDVRYNPIGPVTGIQRVVRGGSSISPEEQLRTDFRGSFPPDYSDPYVGFRCVRDVK